MDSSPLCKPRTSRYPSWVQKRKRNQRSNSNIHWITEKAREFQKNIYLCFIDHAKAIDCVDHKELWKALKEMGIPDHLTCLLRNLYAGQEATVKTLYGITDRFKIEKEGCLQSLCLFNLYAGHIIRNAWMSELQAGTQYHIHINITIFFLRHTHHVFYYIYIFYGLILQF